MTRRYLAFVLALALSTPALAQASAPSQTTTRPSRQTGSAPFANWKQIPVPPLPPFHPQEPRRVQLANGMVIFLQEDHELPLIDGTANIRGGSRDEPAAKTGMLDIYGDVWRTGGTTDKTGDQLDDFLEARAAKVETGSGADSTSISFSSLKQDFEPVFAVFLDLLRNPAFRQDKLDLEKTQFNSAISRRNDDIADIVGRESAKLAYGPDNPYARVAEYDTIAAVTRDDLVKWHEAHVHPNNIIFGISGDFDSAQMEARLRQAFDSWPKGETPPEVKVEFQEPKPGIYFISKEDVNQSAIRQVALGITRRNPDYYAIRVMNQVLGGGFFSRLVRIIRTEKGLAYDVGGGVGAGWDHPGIFELAMGTKSATTVESVQALTDVLKDLIAHPATDDEIRHAKDAILNAFVFNFDSKRKVLGERMLYEFYGYPPDFLEQFRAGIEKVTTTDVDRVAHKYVHPEQFATLVVGNASEFDKPLTTLGAVKTIDITIPPPGGMKAEHAEKNPGPTTPAALSLMSKVQNFLGPEAKLQEVKGIWLKSDTTAATPQGEMNMQVQSTMVYPDHSRSEVQAAQFPAPLTMISTPTGGFMSMEGQGSRPMPGQQNSERQASIKRDIIFLVQHAADPQFVFALDGTEKIDNLDAQAIDISSDGVEVRWYVDPQSGRILRSAFNTIGQQGPVRRTVDYSDWRDVAGIKIPFKRVISDNGQPSGSDVVQEFKLNPTVDAKAFHQPETH